MLGPLPMTEADRRRIEETRREIEILMGKFDELDADAAWRQSWLGKLTELRAQLAGDAPDVDGARKALKAIAGLLPSPPPPSAAPVQPHTSQPRHWDPIRQPQVAPPTPVAASEPPPPAPATALTTSMTEPPALSASTAEPTPRRKPGLLERMRAWLSGR